MVVTQGMSLSEEYFYVLAGTGNRACSSARDRGEARPDLAPGQTTGLRPPRHRRGADVAVNQRFVLWRAKPIEGEATVIRQRLAHRRSARTLH